MWHFKITDNLELLPLLTSWEGEKKKEKKKRNPNKTHVAVDKIFQIIKLIKHLMMSNQSQLECSPEVIA